MGYYPGVECVHGYDACPICDAPKPKRVRRPRQREAEAGEAK